MAKVPRPGALRSGDRPALPAGVPARESLRPDMETVPWSRILVKRTARLVAPDCPHGPTVPQTRYDGRGKGRRLTEPLAGLWAGGPHITLTWQGEQLTADSRGFKRSH